MAISYVKKLIRNALASMKIVVGHIFGKCPNLKLNIFCILIYYNKTWDGALTQNNKSVLK